MKTTTVARRFAVVLVAGMCFGMMHQADAQTLPVLANVSANADKQAALVTASTGATAVIGGSSPLTGAAMAISDTAYDPVLHHMFVVDVSNNKLLTISMVNGAVVNNPTLTLPAGALGVTDLEWDGSTTLFGIVTKTGGDKQLATFNITSGAVSLVGASGIEAGANVGTFSQPFDLDPVGHRYYMVGSPAAGDKLYAINTTTGAVADSVLLAGKLPAGTTTIFGLEYDTGESKLYGLIGLSSGDKQLVSINTTSGGTFGNITLIGAAGFGGGSPVSLSGAEALNPSGNTYYAKGSIGGNAVLLAIDTVTGVAAQHTLTFSPTINDVRALEFQPASVRIVGHGDFNGDGKGDILLRDATGGIGMWIMNGASITSGAFVGNPGVAYTVAGVGDFNGDGKADILLRDANGNLGMWLMNGSTTTSGAFVGNPGASYEVVGVGDFNGDGKADILLRDPSGSLGMWLMNGAVISSGAFVGAPGPTYDVAGVADFNGDGKTDILIRDSAGNLGMWIMNGAAITSGAFVGNPGTNYSVADVGDFNGDLKADILLRDTNGNLGMWLMNGPIISAGAFVGAPGGSYEVAAVNDYSGDGKRDILLRDGNGSLGMWIMNGAAITSGAFVGAPGAGYTEY